jgi:hypothetical protein
MGVEQSREVRYDLEEVTKNRTIEFWKIPRYELISRRTQGVESGTLGEKTIKYAVRHIVDFLKNVPSPTILEIGSGNGYNTKIIFEKLSGLNITFIATDLYEYTPSYFKIETGLLSHDAIKKYKGKFNILLLVSPLNNNYMDYYAIKEFENIEMDKTKYVIFIGELGASDGGDGMYQYMLNDSIWKLKEREMLSISPDICGGSVEKELFIFSSE